MTALIVSPPLGLNVYQVTRNILVTMLSHAQALQSQITSSSIQPTTLLALLNDCAAIASFATQVSGNANLIASILSLYAADQQTTTTTAGTELNAMATASAALATAIQTDFPKTGSILQYETFTAGGGVGTVVFTAAQFPNTATALTAWLATVS